MAQSNEQGSDAQERINLYHELAALKSENGGYVAATITDFETLADFILADRKQHELEARIDELSKIDFPQSLSVLTKNEKGNTEWLNGRLAELKLERERLQS